MKRQITFRQYRAMDLFLFTALLCICETLITFAATRWFPGQPYTLCITPAVTAIVLVRWGPFAAIPAVAGSFAFCVASGATLQQYAIYCIGSHPALPAGVVCLKTPAELPFSSALSGAQTGVAALWMEEALLLANSDAAEKELTLPGALASARELYTNTALSFSTEKGRTTFTLPPYGVALLTLNA